MATVGQSLSQTITQLTDVIDALPDGPQRDKLIGQQKALARELQALIDKTVAADTEEYLSATAALDKANSALVTARTDIQNVAQTITAVAQAVEAVAALAASL